MSKLCFEFSARWARPKEMSEEDEAIRETNRILGRNQEPSNDVLNDMFEFVYNPIVLDLNDVKAFNRLDAEHVTVRDYDKDVYIIHMEYDIFATIYEEITGVRIRNINSLNIEQISEDEDND